MSGLGGSLDTNDSTQWSTAGIRDCWLGGSHNTATDRRIAAHILVGAPYLPYMVRVYRALLERMAHYLVGVGIRQFLDLGSGLPTAGNVHEVVQRCDPTCRVVYVDIDPGVVATGRSLLTGNDQVEMVRADLRRPEQVLDAAVATGLLDPQAPVAVLLTDVLHHISDADDLPGVTGSYVAALAPGSYLAIAHTSDGDALSAGLDIFHQFYHIPIPPLTFRNREQIEELFKGLALVAPGVVPVPLWCPTEGEDLGADPEHFPAHCALGRKV